MQYNCYVLKYEEVDASELQSILGTKSKDKIPLLCCTSAPDSMYQVIS